MNKQECEQICCQAATEIKKRITDGRKALYKLVEHSSINENVIEFFSTLLSSVFGKSGTKVVLTHSSNDYLYNTSISTWIISNDQLNFKMTVMLTTYMTLHMSPLSKLLTRLSAFGLFKQKSAKDLRLNAKTNYVLTGYYGLKKMWDITDIIHPDPIPVHNSAWIYEANETKQRVEKYENEWREWYFGKNSNAS